MQRSTNGLGSQANLGGAGGAPGGNGGGLPGMATQNSTWRKNLTIKVEEETITKSEFITTPTSDMHLLSMQRITPSAKNLLTPMTSATPNGPTSGGGGGANTNGKFIFNASVHP